MPNHSLSALLPDLLARTRAAEDSLVGGLDAAERAAAGTLERWSAKDLVAHCTSWHANLIAMLEAALAGATPSAPAGALDEVNARTFAANQARAWDEVLPEAHAALDRIAALLPQFGDEDLLAPDRYAWRRGQPLAIPVVLRLHWHPMVHFAQFYVERGERAAAGAIRDNLLTLARELAWAPPLAGQTLYVAATCSVALGETAAGLAELRECLALAPHMRDWSQRDPSLAPLRREPGYAALYEAPAGGPA